MSKIYTSKLDYIFAALSDPTRRAILETLQQGEKPVMDIAKDFAITFQATSKHLKVLDRAGLIKRKKIGRQSICIYNPQPMSEAFTWMAQQYDFWQSNFDSLEQFLDNLKPNSDGQDLGSIK